MRWQRNCTMTNRYELMDELQVDPRILDDKKEQTTKKIEYVRAYVKEWLYVMTGKPGIKTITFIDAMCNAGIYRDGDLATAGEVCLLFRDFAKQHRNLIFNLYINDANQKRVDTCAAICNYLIDRNCSNVKLLHASSDVNKFLYEAARTDEVPRGLHDAVLLFVDPYNAHTVHLGALKAFIKSRYCEVLFNWFSSDPVRNKESKAIADCLDGLEISEDMDAGKAIGDELRVGSMKYVFRYTFCTRTNSELYQIIFVTPHEKGLEKLKQALWETFHGAPYHRNKNASLARQATLFDEDTIERTYADQWGIEAQQRLLVAFSSRSGVTYEEIKVYVLEQTMLREGQIIRELLKPLINKGLITKDGNVIKRNFKEDTYTFLCR